jgi:Uncharacterized proteins, homologs of microcin C7 resistance protein MccF
MKIKPKGLTLNSTIGIIAPSSPCYETNKILRSVEVLKGMGFKIAVGESVYERKGYLSGEDSVRAKDINEFFLRKDIDGIMCLRGGYGIQRVLDKIDYEAIRQNPKVFIGYSDITAIHTAINKICGMITFHGPMAIEFDNYISSFSINSLINSVMLPVSTGEFINPDGSGNIGVLVPGEAEGILTGGNLSMIVSSIGTPYEIDTRGKILFLEDVGEEPYRIDRMLTQLILSKKIQECSGIVLGQWTDCEPKEPGKSLSFMDVLKDRLIPAGKPVLYNLASGHDKVNMTLPLGTMVRITMDGRFILEEEGVI